MFGFRSTLLANAYLVIGSVFWGAVAILLQLVAPRRAGGFWSGVQWGRGLLRCAGARVETEFEEPLPPGRYVFLPNHQSLFDIPLMLLTLPTASLFLAKRSLFRIPVFGWAMRVTGFVPVDRGDGKRAREAFAMAVGLIKGGRSLVVFPEETRSPDGRILPFKPGGLLIALRAGVPVVPVGIHGTRAMRSKGSLGVRPGAVLVRYGRPIDVRSIGVRRRRELLGEIRREVARLSGEQLGREEVIDSSGAGNCTASLRAGDGSEKVAATVLRPQLRTKESEYE